MSTWRALPGLRKYVEDEITEAGRAALAAETK